MNKLILDEASGVFQLGRVVYDGRKFLWSTRELDFSLHHVSVRMCAVALPIS
jgi:hypothetical protein